MYGLMLRREWVETKRSLFQSGIQDKKDTEILANAYWVHNLIPANLTYLNEIDKLYIRLSILSTQI